MQEKKAQDITVLDLRSIFNSIADYFVICTATSDTQAEAISDSVEEFVSRDCNVLPWHIEGRKQKEWILLDYSDVVVHVFKQDKRNQFRLENLWGDAQIEYINN